MMVPTGFHNPGEGLIEADLKPALSHDASQSLGEP